MEQLAEAIVRVAGIVKKAGFDVSDNPEYEVQNIVASADLGQPVNLTSVVLSLGLDKVEYEPEVFPGLVYRLSDPKVVILLFGSGRLVCTGGRTFNDVEAAVDKVAEELCSIC